MLIFLITYLVHRTFTVFANRKVKQMATTRRIKAPLIFTINVLAPGYFRITYRSAPFSYPEPFLRAVRRGALAKSKTGNHKNMVKDIYVIRTITFVVANQMPV